LINEKHHRYLDTCNNVAAVGHSHPTVVHRGQQALAQIQTNGRFLNEVQQRYLAKLLKMFPAELNTVYLVNSGSEANDLALSIARAHSKARRPDDVMILDVAYHGHTSCLMDISPYKWYQAVDGKKYHKNHVHVLSIPDAFRGRYRGMTSECGSLYAAEAEAIVEKTGGVGTFIAESAMGCGGIIMHPPTYLQKVYAAVQGAGGVCIADEVACCASDR
jgi:4-aminobutyrate aminotransferase-like enzyme